MHKRTITIICLLFSASTFAAGIDSIGIENSNGKKIILHKIEAKETYYSLGRKYSVLPKEIIKFNNNISLQIGTLVKVPTERLFEEIAPAPSAAGSTTYNPEETVIEYKVGSKETLYAVAKRFNMSVDDLKLLNNLQGSSLSIGQILKVKTSNTSSAKATNSVESRRVQIPAVPASTTPNGSKTTTQNTPSSATINTGRTGTKTAPESSVSKPETTVVDVQVAATRDSTVPDTTSLPHDRKLHANKFGLREVNEKGVAVWIEDENVDTSKMLVLHKTAPVGTVIKITNPMTERSTFAKVVGKFTENESNRDAIIVVTKAAASLLGALDKRFQVNLIYGVPNTGNE